MNIPILYEDNHLLVVEKPCNVPVQADQSQDADLLQLLKDDLKVRYNKPGNVYLGLVHRLDRPVGGAMVFAKTSKAASRLSDTLRKREMQRVYYAVVRGQLRDQRGTLEHYLWKNRATNEVAVVQKNHRDAKLARLSYERLATDAASDTSLVRVELETGRSHQIRVQFAALGHALYGDQKYGQALNKKGQQIALWSQQLAFSHPTTKEWLVFTCEPPSRQPWTHYQW